MNVHIQIEVKPELFSFHFYTFGFGKCRINKSDFGIKNKHAFNIQTKIGHGTSNMNLQIWSVGRRNVQHNEIISFHTWALLFNTQF